MTSITDVEHALKGISFPKNKSEIVKYAQDNKASNEIVSDLRALPDKTYNNAIDVAKEFKGKHMK
jgi:Protein of unknown function (DUF2795)